ncbi:MAG: EFR1 family ferrodoxin [Caulobacteraceae bacterium]
MSNVEIYYFSGTGNSLHVARELQERIPETKLIPIVSLLNKEVIETNAETIGFVFPIYLTAIPIPVKNFIKKPDLRSAKYIFAMATRIGTTHSAFISVEKILKKKGKRLNSHFSLNMASNDPKFDYKVPTEEEIAKLEAAVHERLDSIAGIIKNKENNREKDIYCTSRVRFLGLTSLLVTLTERLKDNLYADSKCTGCGICEKVIKMEDGKPVWQDDIKCYHCAACLNYCPMQSAQIKSYTEKNGRYSHPYATVEDIAVQKHDAAL